MAAILPTSLTKYSLSEAEYKAGSMFTLAQHQVIQNLIAEASEEKVALKYDPNNPVLFAQREAELQGKIGILKFLLENSVTLQSEALQATQSNQQ